MATPQTPGTQLTVQDKKFIEMKNLFTQRGLDRVIAESLPKMFDAGRFIRIAYTALRRNPDLLECDVNSIAGSIIMAAQIGLELDPTLGQAALVPYKDRSSGKKMCQFQPMYRGYIQLSRRSGEIKALYPQVVHAGEFFDYEQGTARFLRHRPDDEFEDKPITHAYAVVEYTNGGQDFEVMSMNAVEKIRAKSKCPDSPAWNQNWDEMAKKTVIRRLAKRLPISAENNALAKAATLDEMADAGVLQHNEAEVESQVQSRATKPSTQDHQAAAATQATASSLADVHTSLEGAETAVSPRPPQPATQSSTGAGSSPAAPRISEDPEWESLDESQPTKKRDEPERGGAHGTPLNFAPYGHRTRGRYE